MKNVVRLIVLLVLLGGCVFEGRADGLATGTRFAVEKLSKEKTAAADATIVVFMPSLTYDCEYASMLTQSFYYYFDRQMAFDQMAKSPRTRVFLVVADRADPMKSTQNLFGAMNVVYDEPGALFAEFGVAKPASKNADATVVLLDAADKIIFVDRGYRAQGEHLKPLENRLKELGGLYQKPVPKRAPKPLKVGDVAPDFRVSESAKLSDLRGQVVLVSFYPAAFSGTLPKPAADGRVLIDGLKRDKQEYDRSLMSCVTQITVIEVSAKEKARRIVVSSSTASLLSEWQRLLGTTNVEYANDADYSASLAYGSYNPAGYNERVSVIVDRRGRIAYIDKHFDAGDEAVLEARMDELLKKKP
ncbi:MAG: redoxin family protein [Acidobacteria bacterium]|nr:redoxin family protein [Acidobacteriota bacterium]